MGTTYSEKYTVTYERKKHVSGGKRKSNGGHQKAIGSGGSHYSPKRRQHKGWYKEFYGKQISKKDYYTILEWYDSLGVSLDNAARWLGQRLGLSSAMVKAIVQDRDK